MTCYNNYHAIFSVSQNMTIIFPLSP